MKFGEELLALREKADGRALTLDEIDAILEGRGTSVIMIVLCLPFLFPMPLPGLSTIMSVVLLFLTGRLVSGKQGRLPRFLGRRTLDYQVLVKVVDKALPLFEKIERLFRARGSLFVKRTGRLAAGGSLLLLITALALPLPPIIPLTNSIPALGIILIALGFLEEDGLFVFLGHVTVLVTWGYFYLWGEVIVLAIRTLIERFGLF